MIGLIERVLTVIARVPSPAIYLFIGAYLALESAGVPIPNDIVLLFGGSLAARGLLSPVFVVLVGTAASLLGANTAYLIGRKGERALILRHGRRVGLDERRLHAIEGWFARSGAVAVFLARLTPFVRTFCSYPAGLLGMPHHTFLLATGLGSLVWCTAITTMGVQVGANYVAAIGLVHRYTLPALLVLAALAVAYLWLHHRLTRLVESRMQRAAADVEAGAAASAEAKGMVEAARD